ncbi:MAG: histidinol dehydrogenase [Anaerolineales bacterium]|nr:histidinol dehydrogenase [Anaerolineales bacterium]
MLKQYDIQTAKQTILKRTAFDLVDKKVLQHVEEILRDVQLRGDIALQHWTQTLDLSPNDTRFTTKPQIDSVSRNILLTAIDSLPRQQREGLEIAKARIESFHRKQPLTSWFTDELGGKIGQIIKPIQRVGLYVPSGTAPLPSTVLMSAIPARVAGVKEIVVVTPPMKDRKEFVIDPVILAACAIAEIDEVYPIGGAQAIGALAYGTQSIKRVDKIFGPGNIYVTLAKQKVFGIVGIDGLAGPTETAVIADEFANPKWVAADLLAQAEHDVLASAILITPSQTLIQNVQVEIKNQIETLKRNNIILASLENCGGAILTRDIQEAIDLVNEYAPEHLGLSIKEPWKWLDKIQNAGGVFMGEHSYEVLGDYVAGPSHVMPTSGTARFASPLNVWDFVKIISVVGLDENAAQVTGQVAEAIALSEKLDAHANAVSIRRGESK